MWKQNCQLVWWVWIWINHLGEAIFWQQRRRSCWKTCDLFLHFDSWLEHRCWLFCNRSSEWRKPKHGQIKLSKKVWETRFKKALKPRKFENELSLKLCCNWWSLLEWGSVKVLNSRWIILAHAEKREGGRQEKEVVAVTFCHMDPINDILRISDTVPVLLWVYIFQRTTL